MSFLTSLAVLILSSLAAGALCAKLRLPPLLGMLFCGIIFGPYVLGVISPELLEISAYLRKFALLVILMRAGLSLDLTDLKKVGRPAVLLCFLPALTEIAGYIAFAPLILGLSVAESALTGAVMSAVSPAVVVPRMLKLKEEKYGTAQGIPQMITAGASCDDVFVVVLFTALLSAVSTGTFDGTTLLKIPLSILSGIAAGVVCGLALAFIFRRFRIQNTVKILILLSVSFLLPAAEDKIGAHVPFSGLLAVITLGVTLNKQEKITAESLSRGYGNIWIFAEILLFALVGAETDVSYAVASGGKVLLVILAALLCRMTGVFLCLIRTTLNFRERLFCAIAYLPKATVQAAIGAIPLAMGLPCGKTILTCAMIAILFTAPLGAAAIDCSYKQLLQKENS